MKNSRKFMTHVSLMLCGILMLAPAMSARAVEGDKTYEEYRSGKAWEELLPEENEYTVICISDEEELAELAANCELDSWSVDKYVKLEKNITLGK